jgi:hypothetical protein
LARVLLEPDRLRLLTILSDLEDALETTPVMPRDALAVAMLKRYVRAIDDCFDALNDDIAAEDGAEHARKVLEIARLGQRVEAMLDRLGMAPSARPVIPTSGVNGGVDPASASLDGLRRDAAAGAPTAGIDYAAAVDPAVTDADTED